MPNAKRRKRFVHERRPLSSVPFSCAIAFSALSSFIATKPNPLERPVSRSVMIVADSTSPNCANRSLRSLSVVWKDRFPTKIFFTILFLPILCRELQEPEGQTLENQLSEQGQEVPTRICNTPSCYPAIICWTSGLSKTKVARKDGRDGTMALKKREEAATLGRFSYFPVFVVGVQRFASFLQTAAD